MGCWQSTNQQEEIGHRDHDREHPEDIDVPIRKQALERVAACSDQS